jgi:hypothetical protein
MRYLLIFVSLLSLSIHGQKLPLVNFNHFYAVIDSTDLHVLQKSAFIKNKFAALVTRTTKADNSEMWTGTYFEGLDNYLELFDVNVGEQEMLDSLLAWIEQVKLTSWTLYFQKILKLKSDFGKDNTIIRKYPGL